MQADSQEASRRLIGALRAKEGRGTVPPPTQPSGAAGGESTNLRWPHSCRLRLSSPPACGLRRGRHFLWWSTPVGQRTCTVTTPRVEPLVDLLGDEQGTKGDCADLVTTPVLARMGMSGANPRQIHIGLYVKAAEVLIYSRRATRRVRLSRRQTPSEQLRLPCAPTLARD